MIWKNACAGAGAALAGALVVLFFAVMALAQPAAATWKPEYAQLPQAMRDWYVRQELTPAAQEIFHFKSCCAHSDVVKTKFRVSKSNAADEWWWLDGDKWKRIPDYAIHWGEAAPDGQPTLFAVGGQPTCFYPPDGGI